MIRFDRIQSELKVKVDLFFFGDIEDLIGVGLDFVVGGWTFTGLGASTFFVSLETILEGDVDTVEDGTALGDEDGTTFDDEGEDEEVCWIFGIEDCWVFGGEETGEDGGEEDFFAADGIGFEVAGIDFEVATIGSISFSNIESSPSK